MDQPTYDTSILPEWKSHSIHFFYELRRGHKEEKKENLEPECMPCSPREYFLISDMICQEKTAFLFFLSFDSQLKAISQLWFSSPVTAGHRCISLFLTS